MAAGLSAIRAGVGTGTEFDCSVPRDGVNDATIPGTSTPCDVNAALAGKASPGGAMASLELFKAGAVLGLGRSSPLLGEFNHFGARAGAG